MGNVVFLRPDEVAETILKVCSCGLGCCCPFLLKHSSVEALSVGRDGGDHYQGLCLGYFIIISMLLKHFSVLGTFGGDHL